ncbi:YdaU family protein [Psychrobacter immobilis]|uniref:YdaU family protein n=2 Tax=Psychrobacter TaxID=497 RepID=UPI00191932F9|nr:YdaU family protein [Psychrobacter immobilis]
MHFYMFNPADFNNSARHLSLPERAIYRDLIDMYYHSEQAIDTSDIDRLARRLLCTSAEYRASLEYVLDEFFVKRGKRHHHHRIDREIKNYKFKNSHTNVTQAVTPSHTHVTSDVTQGHANIDVTMTAAERQRKSRQDKRKMIDDLTNIGVSVDSSIKLTDLRELHASHIDAVTEYVTNNKNDDVTQAVTSGHNDVTQGHIENAAITSNHELETNNHKPVSDNTRTHEENSVVGNSVDNSTDDSQQSETQPVPVEPPQQTQPAARPATKADQIRDQRADDIENWEAPTIDEMRGQLFKAGQMIQLTDDQYQFEISAFKAYYAEQALIGKPLSTESNRKVRLVKWMIREANNQKANQARQEKAKGRFSTDNEDWGTTGNKGGSSFDSDLPPIYHPSHSTSDAADEYAPLSLNGCKRPPLEGMTTAETEAYVDRYVQSGEARVTAYDRLSREMKEAV